MSFRTPPSISFMFMLLVPLLAPAAHAQQSAPATLHIDWPVEGSTISLGKTSSQTIGVVASSNFLLKPAGQCGSEPRCGHIHLKIDPEGDTCNQPGKPYNSMNSDFGGPLVAAHFGHCQSPAASHVIGILLADDHHQPVLVDGKPVTALVRVHTTTTP